eukprot:TRINITY_DN12517_c0_g2_i4.p1 TRINITY_DN12517_c0_g2~~TRINITY_DN12517_c0_g2_i4.p1  ORF type:complete len:775 (+),score=216.62 TRINITY_DN12517_c0_g2_i4:49-2325(+)
MAGAAGPPSEEEHKNAVATVRTFKAQAQLDKAKQWAHHMCHRYQEAKLHIRSAFWAFELKQIAEAQGKQNEVETWKGWLERMKPFVEKARTEAAKAATDPVAPATAAAPTPMPMQQPLQQQQQQQPSPLYTMLQPQPQPQVPQPQPLQPMPLQPTPLQQTPLQPTPLQQLQAMQMPQPQSFQTLQQPPQPVPVMQVPAYGLPPPPAPPVAMLSHPHQTQQIVSKGKGKGKGKGVCGAGPASGDSYVPYGAPPIGNRGGGGAAAALAAAPPPSPPPAKGGAHVHAHAHGTEPSPAGNGLVVPPKGAPVAKQVHFIAERVRDDMEATEGKMMQRQRAAVWLALFKDQVVSYLEGFGEAAPTAKAAPVNNAGKGVGSYPDGFGHAPPSAEAAPVNNAGKGVGSYPDGFGHAPPTAKAAPVNDAGKVDANANYAAQQAMWARGDREPRAGRRNHTAIQREGDDEAKRLLRELSMGRTLAENYNFVPHGLQYVQNCLPQAEQQQLFEAVDSFLEPSQGGTVRVTEYGYRFDTEQDRLLKTEPLPPWSGLLVERLRELGHLARDAVVDQVSVADYVPTATGEPPLVKELSCYKDQALTVVLGSPVTTVLANHDDTTASRHGVAIGQALHLLAHPGSVMVCSGRVLQHWKRGIGATLVDITEHGHLFSRERALVVTLRTVDRTSAVVKAPPIAPVGQKALPIRRPTAATGPPGRGSPPPTTGRLSPAGGVAVSPAGRGRGVTRSAASPPPLPPHPGGRGRGRGSV